MQVRRFFVHVYHCRHDIFPTYPVNEKVCRPLEKCLYLLWGLLLEKFRAGGNQRVNKPGAVFTGAAACLFDTALNEVVVSAFRFNNVEVVFAFCRVNVGVAGILLFLPFVMGFQRPRRVTFMLLKSQDCVLWHGSQTSFLRTVRGLFWGRGI